MVALKTLLGVLEEEQRNATKCQRLGKKYVWFDDCEMAKQLSKILRRWGARPAQITEDHVDRLRKRLGKTDQLKQVFPEVEARRECFLTSLDKDEER